MRSSRASYSGSGWTTTSSVPPPRGTGRRSSPASLSPSTSRRGSAAGTGWATRTGSSTRGSRRCFGVTTGRAMRDRIGLWGVKLFRITLPHQSQTLLKVGLFQQGLRLPKTPHRHRPQTLEDKPVRQDRPVRRGVNVSRIFHQHRPRLLQVRTFKGGVEISRIFQQHRSQALLGDKVVRQVAKMSRMFLPARLLILLGHRVGHDLALGG